MYDSLKQEKSKTSLLTIKSNEIKQSNDEISTKIERQEYVLDNLDGMAKQLVNTVLSNSLEIIKMNSIENAVVFLPALWILAAFVSDRVAAVAALLWLAGRVWYALSYQREPASRRPSFVFSTLIYVTTWLGALWGIAQTIRAGV